MRRVLTQFLSSLGSKENRTRVEVLFPVRRREQRLTPLCFSRDLLQPVSVVLKLRPPSKKGKGERQSRPLRFFEISLGSMLTFRAPSLAPIHNCLPKSLPFLPLPLSIEMASTPPPPPKLSGGFQIAPIPQNHLRPQRQHRLSDSFGLGPEALVDHLMMGEDNDDGE